MGISDRIEAFICELLKKEDDGWVELGRNELAGIFNCVPSQINYVIRTRFTPERGYAVESRRGGGGYLKIRRTGSENRIIAAIGDEISEEEARQILLLLKECGAIGTREAKAIYAAATVGIRGLQNKDETRANILKAALQAATEQKE
jgi:transcriptional regulator CtsR